MFHPAVPKLLAPWGPSVTAWTHFQGTTEVTTRPLPARWPPAPKGVFPQNSADTLHRCAKPNLKLQGEAPRRNPGPASHPRQNQADA